MTGIANSVTEIILHLYHVAHTVSCKSHRLMYFQTSSIHCNSHRLMQITPSHANHTVSHRLTYITLSHARQGTSSHSSMYGISFYSCSSGHTILLMQCRPQLVSRDRTHAFCSTSLMQVMLHGSSQRRLPSEGETPQA